jgi:hypothetical protein
MYGRISGSNDLEQKMAAINVSEYYALAGVLLFTFTARKVHCQYAVISTS